jgi:hypothetical protein
MVAAEKGVPAEDDIFPIYPILVFTSTVLVDQSIFQIDIAAPRTKRIRRDCGVISQQIITPLSTQSSGKAHKGHLYRRCTGGKDFVSRSSCIAIEIDKNVNAIVNDLIDEALC